MPVQLGCTDCTKQTNWQFISFQFISRSVNLTKRVYFRSFHFRRFVHVLRSGLRSLVTGDRPVNWLMFTLHMHYGIRMSNIAYVHVIPSLHWLQLMHI